MASHQAMVPIVYSEEYAAYFFGPEHPFSPVRQEMALDLLRACGAEPACQRPGAAGRESLLAVHSEAFVRSVERASSGKHEDASPEFGLGTPDVPVFPDMHDAASILTGGSLHAADLISEDEAPKVLQFGGGLHHARHAEASGFCVYNDLSVAIARFQRRGWRVAYIDVDVHHGDGVQAIHYEQGDVLTISIHESGRYLYPGTGFVHEIGAHAGKGYKLNIPLEPGTTDTSFLESFERVVPHALAWFQPDVIVAQCGADGHFRDPLADLALTTHAYESVFRRIFALADDYAHGRLLATLGGGYDPDPTARIWAMLALILNDQTIPESIPSSYLERWSGALNLSLHPTMHDSIAEIDHEGRAAAERQNRTTSRRLMEMAPPLWY
jgi:acetoin utilization protein AcuC